MLLNDWITQNWKSLEQASRNISRGAHLSRDLLQHCVVDFLEKPQAQSIVDGGFARFFIVKMMMNQWRSVTSSFYRLYRSNDTVSADKLNIAEWYAEDAIEPDWDLEKVKSILNTMGEDHQNAGWYHVKLIELYAETPNYKRLSEMTKISRTSISKSVDRARTQIKGQYYGL